MWATIVASLNRTTMIIEHGLLTFKEDNLKLIEATSAAECLQYDTIKQQGP